MCATPAFYALHLLFFSRTDLDLEDGSGWDDGMEEEVDVE
jgi:hypothetical protein